jgi:hypothetical protein
MNIPNAWEHVPLEIALSRHHAEATMQLIYRGALIDKVVLKKYTLPIAGVQSTFFNQMMILIRENGHLAREIGNSGSNLMHLSVLASHTSLVHHLAEKMENIDATNDDGSTALHIALREYRTDIATILIDRGADINAQIVHEGGDESGRTPLHYAAMHGSALVRRLLELGADPFAVDEAGKDAEWFAGLCQKSSILRLILDAKSSARRGTEGGFSDLLTTKNTVISDEKLQLQPAKFVQVDPITLRPSKEHAAMSDSNRGKDQSSALFEEWSRNIDHPVLSANTNKPDNTGTSPIEIDEKVQLFSNTEAQWVCLECGPKGMDPDSYFETRPLLLAHLLAEHGMNPSLAVKTFWLCSEQGCTKEKIIGNKCFKCNRQHLYKEEQGAAAHLRRAHFTSSAYPSMAECRAYIRRTLAANNAYTNPVLAGTFKKGLRTELSGSSS